MYYRQRILLELVQEAKIPLTATHTMKLLFLLSQESERNLYDFFPTTDGGFSYIAQRDIATLLKKGLLKTDTAGYLRNSTPNDSRKIASADNAAIQSVLARFGSLSIAEIQKLISKKYPAFHIENKLFKRNNTSKNGEFLLSSLGYEGMNIDLFLRIIIESDIKMIIDVRRNPVSMKFDFNKGSLSTKLPKCGVAYLHIPELGIPAELRCNLENYQNYVNLFDYYEQNILNKAEAQLDLIRKLNLQYRRISLLCFEKDARYCHRTRILDKLNNYT